MECSIRIGKEFATNKKVGNTKRLNLREGKPSIYVMTKKTILETKQRYLLFRKVSLYKMETVQK